jgi:endonuclease/exonuclease/phosphatase family metal-dependent hydrolase
MNTLKIKPAKLREGRDRWGVKQKIATFSMLGLTLLTSSQASICQADSAPPKEQGRRSVVACSQNLENLGSLELMKQRGSASNHSVRNEKIKGLVERITRADCDIVGLQELLGSQHEGEVTAKELADALLARTGKHFDSAVGQSGDPSSGVGFLFSAERFKLIFTGNHQAALPKLTFLQQTRRFVRAPFEIRLAVKDTGAAVKALRLVTFHFKSKSTRSGSDITGLKYEDWRMESAETLRNLALSFKQPQELLLLMGDRNSDLGTASARILEGHLYLSDFMRPPGGQVSCKIGSEGMPLCLSEAGHRPVFGSVLEAAKAEGSFFYKGRASWLDDILMPIEQFSFARSYHGAFVNGVVAEPPASDHSLVYITLGL